MNIADLEAKLRIDEHHLEHMRRDQPELLYAVSKRVAQLMSKRDTAKKMLKEVEAEVALEIRSQAAQAQEKVTDKGVEAETCIHRDVRTARDAVTEAEAEYNAWDALRESFKDRSYAIRDLIELWLANYYGADMERGVRRDMVKERADQVMHHRQQRYEEGQQRSQRPRMHNVR